MIKRDMRVPEIDSRVLIGTGDPDAPEIISTLTLPKCWKAGQSQGRSI